MELNEMMKKFMDTALGVASTAAEKVVEFTNNMSQKGSEMKETKKEELEKFFHMIKDKFEESTKSVMSVFKSKAKKIEELEKEIESLKKEINEIKKKVK